MNNRGWRALALGLIATLGCGRGVSGGPRGADVVLQDGALASGQAVSIAVQDGVIVAVGDTALVAKLIGPATRVLALDGAVVVAGLVDAHAHLYGLGVDLENVSVREATSAEAAAATVADAARGRQPSEWVIGRGWDQNKWPGQAFPHRAVLDVVVPTQPVILRRVDGHAAWVNSAALAHAGITAATVDPAGGKIVRDDTGTPTGILIDNAIDLVDRVLPAPTDEARQRRILAGAKLAVSLGLTGVHEMGIDDATTAAYQALAARDALPLRVRAYRAVSGPGDAALRTPPPAAAGWFELAGVKLVADGALGSRGARLLEPYADDPGNQGLWVTEPGALAAIVREAMATGWQVAIHAIGDAGVRASIDAIQAGRDGAAVASLRPRIEHAQVIALADIPRFAAVGIIASMQPTHATSDMPWAEARVGAARIAGAYAWETLRKAGVRLALGSDFPVEDANPVLGLVAAVTRQDLTGQPTGGWRAHERMTLADALAGFSQGAAYAGFVESRRGRIEVGLDADLTVLDRLGTGLDLANARVVHTLVGGRVVYSRQP